MVITIIAFFFKVAARVRTPDGEEQLILAEIVSFNPSSNKYPFAFPFLEFEKRPNRYAN